MDGLPSVDAPGARGRAPRPGPRWLLAELSYRCPLRCVYCSNPTDHAALAAELETADWVRVLREARALGAVQLGFSGGEPLVRADLEALVAEGRSLGYYTNLITSGIGLTAARLARLKERGLDHVQLSLQAATPELNDALGGARTFQRKLAAARLIKDGGYPMVLNVVLHRHNIGQVPALLALATELGADYVELASVQYDGWAIRNRDELLPARAQLAACEAAVAAFRAAAGRRAPKIYYVVPDYFEGRPKPCGGGWAETMLVVAPDGLALPCHGARKLPLAFPSVRASSVASAWFDSDAFNRYRGDAWMPEPCRSCPEKGRDFGGCRCQAFLLTGDAAATDPACDRSPRHGLVAAAAAAADAAPRPGDGLDGRPRRPAEMTYRDGQRAGAMPADRG